ncbi:hypothetical protein MRX96_017869 [Rhipicephalus microplus]|uniref:Uncharacterized protein n=1 Tax=Rhipicephalus microplus TaxID=6941 RepID=A0A9J6EY67_RHIMP|nr:hypothetical protein HPB51_003910 [Rhipicephalus microplus]
MELPSQRQCIVRRLLADIGFKLENRSRDSLLINRDDINWRNRYIYDVERYQAEGRYIYYLDEICVTANTLGRSCGQTPWCRSADACWLELIA